MILHLSSSLFSYVWGCSETGALGIAELLHPRKAKITGEYWQRNERAKKKRQAPDPILTVTKPYKAPQPDFYGLEISHVSAGHGFTIMVNANKKSKRPQGNRFDAVLCGVCFRQDCFPLLPPPPPFCLRNFPTISSSVDSLLASL